jgi:predicted Rossmann fold nucleotide-binding protein DprA/Smf involved in DNA uptake
MGPGGRSGCFGASLTGLEVAGEVSLPQNSPIRNRIVRGISVWVLVIEAAERDENYGRCAMEQDREIFAITY